MAILNTNQIEPICRTLLNNICVSSGVGMCTLSGTCRDGGVHNGQERDVLFHGDEHATAGGAPSHRDDYQHRPGRVAD